MTLKRQLCESGISRDAPSASLALHFLDYHYLHVEKQGKPQGSHSTLAFGVILPALPLRKLQKQLFPQPKC